MKLIIPNLDFLTSWVSFVEACDSKNISGFWDCPERPEAWGKYIEEIQANITPAPLVPASTFWLVEGEEIVGVINIRHFLNDNLREFGGNIGCYVRPSCWGKGYGTNILKLGLLEAEKIGLEKVLITCADNNPASVKVIEKNGGILEKKAVCEDRLLRYYWVEVN